MYSKEVEELSDWCELNLSADLTKNDCLLLVEKFKPSKHVSSNCNILPKSCSFFYRSKYGCSSCSKN